MRERKIQTQAHKCLY